MKKLIIIAIVLGIVGLTHWRTHPKPQLVSKSECPIWICTPPPDSRTVEQWITQCKPVEAYDPKIGAHSYWCTSDQNPLDHDQLLPAGYVIVK